MGLESCSPPAKRYGNEAKPAARSQVSATTRKPSRTPRRLSGRAESRSSAHPRPTVIAPAARNGQNGSPYPRAMTIGKTAASPRYLPRLPTRWRTAHRSMAIRRGRPIRAVTCVNSECLDDPRRVRGLREDDHPVPRLEDVVAVGEDRVPVPDDRADDRAVDGHVPEGHTDVAARVSRRHVEYLVPVALEHHDLLRARIVREAHDLLRGDRARVDRYVYSCVVERGDRRGLVCDRDREGNPVHLRDRGRVQVFRVVAHREDAGLCLADTLALEEVGVETSGVE